MLPNLPVGPYRLEANLAGFRSFERAVDQEMIERVRRNAAGSRKTESAGKLYTPAPDAPLKKESKA